MVTNKITISLYNGNGTDSDPVSTIIVGTGFVPTKPEDYPAAREGYEYETFVVCEKNAETGEIVPSETEWDPTAETTATADFSVMPNWNAVEYTIHFEANGGEGTMEDQKVVYDDTKAKLTANSFTGVEGNIFYGWATAADGKVKFANGLTISRNQTFKDEAYNAETKTLTLYAVWGAPAASITTGEGDAAQTNYYTSVTAALSAAKTGETVVLCSDVTAAAVLSKSKDVTLDLNGHSITVNNTAVTVSAGKLTIVDSSESKTGTITATKNYALNASKEGAEIAVKSGNVIGNLNAVEGAKIALSGGNYSADLTDAANAALVANCYKVEAYTGENEELQYTVVADYVFDVDGKEFQTAEEAVAALKSDGQSTLKLLKSVNADTITMPAGTDVILDLDGNELTALINLQGSKLEVSNGTLKAKTNGTEAVAITGENNTFTLDENAKISGVNWGLYVNGTGNNAVTIDGEVTGIVGITSAMKGEGNKIVVNGSVSASNVAGDFTGAVSVLGNAEVEIAADASVVNTAASGNGLTVNSADAKVTVKTAAEDNNADTSNVDTVKGGQYGIEVKAGTVSVKGGTISGGSGAINAAAGTVAISGGTFNGDLALTDAEATITNDDAMPYFNGTITSNKQHFISAGSFDTRDGAASSLLVEEYLLIKNDAGRYEVAKCTHDNSLNEDRDECVTCGASLLYTVNVSSKDDKGNNMVVSVKGGGKYKWMSGDITIEAPVLDDYKFVNWTDAEGNVFAETAKATIERGTKTGSISLTANYKAAKKVRLEITASSFIYNERERYDGLSASLEVASTVKVAYADKTKQFVAWVNEADKIVSRSEEYEFIITAATQIKAVTAPKDREEGAFVVYMDGSGSILSRNFCYADQELEVPPAPSRIGMRFLNWSLDVDEIKALMAEKDVIEVNPIFDVAENAGDSNMKINVYHVVYGSEEPEKDTKMSKTYPIGHSNAVKALGEYKGAAFSYWSSDAKGETVVSYNPTFTFERFDGDLYAVYGKDVKAAPVVTVTPSSVINGSKYTTTFSVTRSIPEGYKLLEAGVVYVRDQELEAHYGSLEQAKEVTRDNVTENWGVKQRISTGGGEAPYLMNISTTNPASNFYLRGFVVVQNSSGNVETIYSETAIGGYNSLNP